VLGQGLVLFRGREILYVVECAVCRIEKFRYDERDGKTLKSAPTSMRAGTRRMRCDIEAIVVAGLGMGDPD